MDALLAVSSQEPEQITRLLLLFSEAEVAGALVRSLPSETYEVISCPLAASQERWVEELRPDLVLLAPPPEQEQFLQACETVRAQLEQPVVVLSELGDEQLITRALAAGIDEYLVLPMGERELAARMQAMMRRLRRYEERNGSLSVGNLVLCAEEQSVKRNGQKICLSPTEFRLLACLASAPGKVFTHQTLMSRVWGEEYINCRHYLRLYIRYLREKLEDEPADPQMIISEWGVGYQLMPGEPSNGRR
jgi:two-component system, OmpR family, KDP operon response regulator KdpE